MPQSWEINENPLKLNAALNWSYFDNRSIKGITLYLWCLESWILSCSFCCITELLIVLNLTKDDSWAIKKWQGREMPPWCDLTGRCCQVEKLRQQVGAVSNPVSPARQHGCNQFKPCLGTIYQISVTVSRQCKADGVSSAPLWLKDTAQKPFIAFACHVSLTQLHSEVPTGTEVLLDWRS